MVDLSPEKFDYTYDPIFLINMMSDMARIDFKLYKGAQAAGRLIFAVKDEFMISGMLMDFNRCMAVTVSSDAENSNPMYHSIRDLCTREMLLYRSTTMQKMIDGKYYVRAILAVNQKWVVGHLTEHFLPDDLFEELLEQVKEQYDEEQEQRIRYLHTLTNKMMETTNISVILHSIALANLAVDGELDFVAAAEKALFAVYSRTVHTAREFQCEIGIRLFSGGFSVCRDTVCIFVGYHLLCQTAHGKPKE